MRDVLHFVAVMKGRYQAPEVGPDLGFGQAGLALIEQPLKGAARAVVHDEVDFATHRVIDYLMKRNNIFVAKFRHQAHLVGDARPGDPATLVCVVRTQLSALPGGSRAGTVENVLGPRDNLDGVGLLRQTIVALLNNAVVPAPYRLP